MNEPTSPFRAISSLEVAGCIAVGAIVYLALRYSGEQGYGVALGITASVLLSCLGTSWPLRKKPWFWLTAIVVVAVHVAGMLSFDLSGAASWTGLTIMPVMAVDTLVTLTLIYIVYRAVHGRPDRLFEPADEEGGYLG